METRGNFGSKLGVILATAGSAVGLGNVWRFPYMAGQNGGAAFILIYLVCIILLGLPGMMSEFIIGRHSASNAARAYSNLGKHKAWGALGLMGVITSMIILGFYAVVAGWCLQYLYASIMGGVHGDAEYVKTYFQTFSADPIRPTLWAVGFILLTHMVVVRGVRNGIEKASKASSDHFVRAFHDTYGMPTIVTNCSNNYGPYQFPEKLIPLFINNIRHRKPLPVYGKGENVRDWLYVVDHARAIDMIFHKGNIAETYNIGGFNEWKNIDIIKVVIKTVDRLLGRKEGEDMDLITYVTDRKGHDMRYAIDSRKLQKELGWEPSLQFEEGIEETVKWYLDNQEWMDHVTSGEYQKYYDNMYKDR